MTQFGCGLSRWSKNDRNDYRNGISVAEDHDELVKVQTAFRAGLPARFCLGPARVDLRHLSSIRLSDRVSYIESYRNPSSDFCQFEGKMVLDLGCSR